jgi:hypothetical protein
MLLKLTAPNPFAAEQRLYVWVHCNSVELYSRGKLDYSCPLIVATSFKIELLAPFINLFEISFLINEK